MLGIHISPRSLLNSLAPAMSRRRKFLRHSKWILSNLHRPGLLWHVARHGRKAWTLDDVYNLHGIDLFFEQIGFRRIDMRKSLDPARSVEEAGRWVLQQLLLHPEERRHTRQPLRKGLSGAFGTFLRERVSGSTKALTNLEAVFAKPPGDEILVMNDEYIDWRSRFPLGFTPAGRGQFFQYLLLAAMPYWKFSFETCLWWLLDCAEDESNGLVYSYRVQPEWQQAHPAALTPEGWEAFKSWLGNKYQITGKWLAEAPLPDEYGQREQKLLHRLEAIEKDPALLKREKSPFGINVLGHFRYPSGLQEAALNFVYALESAQVPVAKRDAPNNHYVDLPHRDGFLDLEMYDVSISAIAPEPLREKRFDHASVWRRDGLYRIANWYWELETILPSWADQTQHFQEMWAPTKFIGHAFEQVTSIPVYHMSAGIRFPEPTGLTRPNLGLPEDAYLFLFMFDMNSIFMRKNPLAVVESFRRAFGKSRNVRLVIKLSRGEVDPKNLKRLEDASAEINALIINRTMTRRESYGLLENCDCYVSLHRSEGYGLTMAEAMSYGKPVIATGYSGNLDFMTEENSRLVPFELIQLDREYFPYPKGAFWADASVEEAAREMRWILDHPKQAEQMAQQGCNDVHEVLSLEAYGLRMRKRLEEILDR